MSDTNRTKLLYSAETTFAEAISGASAMTRLRIAGESLRHVKPVVRSDEMREDLTDRDLIQVGVGAAGQVQTEFYHAGLDDFIAAALMGGAFVSGSEAVTGTFSSAAQTFTLDSGTFPAALKKARFVKLANCATAGHDGIHRVVSITDTVITFPSGTITADDATDAITVDYRYIRNGITRKSFLLQKETPDVANHFVAFSGMMVNQLTLDLPAREKVGLDLDFIGYSGFSRTTTAAGGGETAANTNKVVETGNDISAFLLSGSAFASPVESGSLVIGNNLRERFALARAGTLELGRNRRDFTGQLNAYFESKDLFDDFVNHTEKALLIALKDASNNVSSFYLPRIVFEEGNWTAEGNDADIMTPLTFRGLKSDETSDGYAVQFDALSA